MSEHTSIEERAEAFETDFAWRGGAVAGAIAAIVVGIVLAIIDLDVIRITIAGLYGMAGNLVVGAIAHLIHGIIFGIVFAFVLMDPALHGATRQYWRSVGLGVLYGLFLAATAAGIIMPIWLAVIGVPDGPPIPNITAPVLVWHVVYGAVVGAVFPYVTDLESTDEP